MFGIISTVGLVLLVIRIGSECYASIKKGDKVGESIASVILRQIKLSQNAVDNGDLAMAEEILNAMAVALDKLPLKTWEIPAILFVRRAGVRFARGNFRGAEEDFVYSEKCMKELGTMEAADFMVRAQTRLHLGRLLGAEEDARMSQMMPYGKESNESKALLYGVVMYCQGNFGKAAKSWNDAALEVGESGCNLRWCALTRMGSVEGATRELAARGEGNYPDSDTNAEWNGYIGKYLRELLTKERLLEIASILQRDGEGADLRKCQATFFIAAKSLAGDPETAKLELKNCLSTKQIHAYEFLMATADLKRLETSQNAGNGK